MHQLRLHGLPLRTLRSLGLVSLIGLGLAPSGIVRAAMPNDKITLTYWDDDNTATYQHGIDPLMYQFSKLYPNVTIKIVHGETVPKLLTAIASGNGPDLFSFWDGPEPLGTLAADGALLPLNDLMKADHFNTNTQLKAALDPSTYLGKVYGLSWSLGSQSYFYNVHDFAAAGITQVPVTTSQLWQDMRKLTLYNSGHHITQIGQVPPNSGGGGWAFYTWVQAFGGSLYDPVKHQVTPDSPGVIAALNDLVTQYKAYGPSNIDRFAVSQANTAGTPADPLFSGSTAMRMDGDWQAFNYGFYKPSLKYGSDWASFAVPYPDGHPERKWAGYVDNDLMVVMAATKHPKESWEFLRYINSGPAAVPAALANASLPGNKTLYSDPRFARLSFWTGNVARMEHSQNLVTFPVTPVSQHYQDVLNADVDLVLHGKETPQAGMAHVKSVIQPELDMFLAQHPDQK